ncbi:hypothetical protein [Amycolatopsis sp. 195334CR]|uniref:hypothetical protein n=1 Tax=Amycolatopsis sp. 195334CR TaxID=2814588 RepID=UPI001A8D9C01|nr:hypothetical protein [Amycolatopsis sp. 195334CR]MBN6039602.1 hypothetical protein [Amycolatopsis sp. 195334CR]
MLVTRRILAGTTAIAAVVLGAAPATAAAADGTWKAYGNTNPITSSASTWTCGGTKSIATSVGAQVCMVVTPNRESMQGAVIVRNNKSSTFSTSAAMHLYRPSGAEVLDGWVCHTSGVAANSWSVCFGKTITHPGPTRAEGFANGKVLGSSPNT